MSNKLRLNAYIAQSGISARRKAVDTIKEGKVRVGGKVVFEPWHLVDDNDIVTVEGKRVSIKLNYYLVLNKPKGVTSTVSDRFAERKITELVPKKYGRLYPVGRLDKDSRGLIILTNDGNLCHNLTHPKFEVEKEYRVIVKGEFESSALSQLTTGVTEKGELLKVKSCSLLSSKDETKELGIIIAEGKKRHIRRMLGCLGLTVLDLKRIRLGCLKLGRLAEGDFLQMDRDEIYKLTIKAKERA